MVHDVDDYLLKYDIPIRESYFDDLYPLLEKYFRIKHLAICDTPHKESIEGCLYGQYLFPFVLLPVAESEDGPARTVFFMIDTHSPWTFMRRQVFF
jgi:hypothetical protein